MNQDTLQTNKMRRWKPEKVEENTRRRNTHITTTELNILELNLGDTDIPQRE